MSFDVIQPSKFYYLDNQVYKTESSGFFCKFTDNRWGFNRMLKITDCVCRTEFAEHSQFGSRVYVYISSIEIIKRIKMCLIGGRSFS